MKQNKKVIGIILILILLNVFWFYTAKVYASEGVRTFDEDDEKTLVRMVTSLSRKVDTNNEINTDTLSHFFDRYVGVGGVNVSTPSSNLIHILFNQSGNLYEIDTLKGVLEFIQDDRCIITYDANGGMLIPYIQTGSQGEQIKITNMKPTRIGYTFLGWHTDPNSPTAGCVPGDLYTVTDSVTLFAVWTQTIDNSYVLSYNANGGTGAPSPQMAAIGQSITVSSQIPTREGHVFKGWAITSFLSVPQYHSGYQYTGVIDSTLYAVWKSEEDRYNITFDANGGSGAPAAITADKNENITLPNTVPERTGYTFLGWYPNDPNASEPLYLPGGSYRGMENVTLHAVWKINRTLTFNANGGSGGPGTLSVPSGTTITIPSTEPTRVGWSFIGWADNEDDEIPRCMPGDQYTVSEGDKIFYALWSNNAWTITYNANGGTFGSTTTITQSVTKEQSATVPNTVPERDGYEFLGWSINQNASTGTYDPGETIPAANITDNIELFAIWEEIVVQYTITFNANSGTGAPNAITVNEGESVTLPDTVPTRTGTQYAFVGWSTTQKNPSTSVTAEYAPGETIPESEIANLASQNGGNITLYATYNQNSTWSWGGTQYYVVLFNQQGGSNGPIALRVTKNSAGTIPTTIPTKDGYTFLGWSTNSNATTVTYEAEESITPSANMTLYAVWIEEGTEMYTVEFIKPTTGWNSYTINNLPDSITVTSGGSITIPNVTPTCTYSGFGGTTRTYTFIGWSTTVPSVPTYTTTNVTAEHSIGDTISNITSKITLYPVFKRTK